MGNTQKIWGFPERGQSIKPKRSNPSTQQRANELRKQPTPFEAKLWAYLRRKQVGNVKFRRQHAIGPFIVDFCAPSRKLVIELDGGHHLEQQAYDAQRGEYLQSHGYHVLRFWNHEVMRDIEAVILLIMDAVKPPPQ